MDELKTTAQRILDALQGEGETSYWLTRFVFLRALGAIYLVAFLVAAHQAIPLIGSDGILPIELYLEGLEATWWELPTLFWVSQSDIWMVFLAWAGVALSAVVMLGWANAPILGALWLLYLSFVNVGQVFYGYGWEMMMVEVGFLAIFLVPPFRWSAFPERNPPPPQVVWLLRWLVFRVMFGAGLIKLRGDPCWDDLTCLMYHYETQPIPNPLSWYLDQMPAWFHRAGVLWNHFVELVVPWFVFGPRRLRHAAGVLLIGFQATLIASGNLSFLNWLTLVACLACFDDSWLRYLVPTSWYDHVRELDEQTSMSLGRRAISWCLVVGIFVLSFNPVLNMISPDQSMNRSFSKYRLVNTYGAFGGVTRTRYEIVVQGTHEEEVDETTEWETYEFPCKPGAPERAPCLVSPYHYRLDWQMWFAAMSPNARHHPWFFGFVYRLLEGHRGLAGLLAHNPFPDRPPRYIRAIRYEYEFTEKPDGERWWRRERTGTYLPPVSLESQDLRRYLQEADMIRSDAPTGEMDAHDQ